LLRMLLPPLQCVPDPDPEDQEEEWTLIRLVNEAPCSPPPLGIQIQQTHIPSTSSVLHEVGCMAVVVRSGEVVLPVVQVHPVLLPPPEWGSAAVEAEVAVGEVSQAQAEAATTSGLLDDIPLLLLLEGE